MSGLLFLANFIMLLTPQHSGRQERLQKYKDPKNYTISLAQNVAACGIYVSVNSFRELPPDSPAR